MPLTLANVKLGRAFEKLGKSEAAALLPGPTLNDGTLFHLQGKAYHLRLNMEQLKNRRALLEYEDVLVNMYFNEGKNGVGMQYVLRRPESVVAHREFLLNAGTDISMRVGRKMSTPEHGHHLHTVYLLSTENLTEESIEEVILLHMRGK